MATTKIIDIKKIKEEVNEEAKLAGKRLKAVVKIAEMARDTMKKVCINLLEEHKAEVQKHLKECHKKDEYTDGFHKGSLATINLLKSRLNKINK